MSCGTKLLDPRVIAAALYAVGFRGDALTKQTAIDLAESCGGYADAHNLGTPGNPEDSRGIGQINVLAHTQYASIDLFNPLFNAQAQWEVSSHGTDLTPWTTYTGGAYQGYLPAAHSAAAVVTDHFGSGGSFSFFGLDVPAPDWIAGPLNTHVPGTGNIGDASRGAADAASGAFDAATAVPKFVERLGGVVFDKSNWWRVALVGTGVVLIGVGVMLYAQTSPAVRQAEAGAAKAAAV